MSRVRICALLMLVAFVAAIGLAAPGVAGAALTTADCIACHGDHAVHVDISCTGAGCHGASEYGSGTFPYFDGDHDDEPCTDYCHTPATHLGTPHSDAQIATSHVTTTPCLDCHSSSLITEHANICTPCHAAGATQRVKDAVAAARTDCAACHDDAGHVGQHALIALPECAACHGADALSIHASCDTCHDPVAPPAGADCRTCHGGIDLTAHGAGPFLKGPFNPAAAGYLSWGFAAALPGNSGTSPHGGYTANTNKCAVCHSVHTARTGGSVLTAGGPYASYAQGCVFCHGVGTSFTDVVITSNADGYVSPHGTCTRCHALNPHGVGTSEYVTLASKLLNKNGDVAIGQDLFAGANGLNVGMFDGTGNVAAGSVLGTGYLCSGCHQQSFAVNTPGTNPAGGGNYGGHRVTAVATADWDQSLYGASYSTAGPIAYANANTCQACHDANTNAGTKAFPHGYVDNTGALSPKTVAGSSYIWLSTAPDVLAAKTLLAGIEPETGDGNANLLTEDGLCLKCHRDGTGNGVGLTF